MKAFAHLDAGSVNQAVDTADQSTVFIAGGTDLLGSLKDQILRNYPATVINLKTIPELDYVREVDGSVEIGALTKIHTLASSALVQEKALCLAQAAAKVSSPTVRMMGTIGGNVCQMHRCWYFRSPQNRFDCLRKGGDVCYAMTGDSRYHSIFAGEDGCIASSSQDTAPALIALNATIKTNKRDIPAQEFFKVNGTRSNVLAENELVTKIIVPPASGSAFQKYALRKAIDFAIVNCAVAQTESGVRIVLGGVAPSPLRALSAEAALSSGISNETADAAAKQALAGATPRPDNAYKLPIAKALVSRTLLELV